jgi:hypothetical protein
VKHSDGLRLWRHLRGGMRIVGTDRDRSDALRVRDVREIAIMDSRFAEYPPTRQEPIAVTGAGVDLPDGVDLLGSLWRLLIAERDGPGRWPVGRACTALPESVITHVGWGCCRLPAEAAADVFRVSSGGTGTSGHLPEDHISPIISGFVRRTIKQRPHRYSVSTSDDLTGPPF